VQDESGEEVEISADPISTPGTPLLSVSLSQPSVSSSSRRVTRSQTRGRPAEIISGPSRPRIRLEGPMVRREPTPPGKFDTPPPPKPRGKAPSKSGSKKGKAKAREPSSSSDSSQEVVRVEQVEDLRARIPKLDPEALKKVLHLATRKDPVSFQIYPRLFNLSDLNLLVGCLLYQLPHSPRPLRLRGLGRTLCSMQGWQTPRLLFQALPRPTGRGPGAPFSGLSEQSYP
jgi:hypothetical protein